MQNCSLKFYPAIERLDLVSPTVGLLLKNWQDSTPVEEIWVAEIDPSKAEGKVFCEHYRIPENAGANCVVVEGIRNEKRTLAACVALVGSKMDFNGVVRKTLKARRVSLAALPLILQETQMEYGSITFIGLPIQWPILLDSQILNSPRIVVGSGLIKSKLSLPTKIFVNHPGFNVIEGLALPA